MRLKIAKSIVALMLISGFGMFWLGMTLTWDNVPVMVSYGYYLIFTACMCIIIWNVFGMIWSK